MLTRLAAGLSAQTASSIGAALGRRALGTATRGAVRQPAASTQSLPQSVLRRRGFCSGDKGKGEGGAQMSWRVAGTTLLTGGVLVGAYYYEKQRRMKAVTESHTSSMGEAAIGGPFEMLDHEGRKFTDKDLLGKWTLLYFGFTTCPDICPEEMEKLGKATDIIAKTAGENSVVPVFVSVDPARDSVKEVKEYVRRYHPKMVGLTGNEKQCKATARVYRVYHHKTSEDSDYLVDHSIIHYLVGPDGKFRKFYLKRDPAEDIASGVLKIMSDEFKESFPQPASADAAAVAAEKK